MTKIAARRPGGPMLVIFDGQSLNNNPAPPDNMPTLAMAGTGIPWCNVAVDATGWNTLLADIDDRLLTKLRTPAYDQYVLVMNGGQNNVALNQTGAQIYASKKAYADAARAGGFGTILGCTLPPSTTYTGPQDTNREAANTLIRASSDGTFEAIIDLDVPPLDDPGSAHYSALHWTVSGAAAAGVLVADTIGGLP